MDGTDFLILLFNNEGIYIALLLFNLVLLYMFLRKRISSVIDPMMIIFILGAFANTVIPFLYVLHYVSLDLLITFYLSEFLYWTGFICVRQNNEEKRCDFKVSDMSITLYKFFLFSICIIVVEKIYSYSVVGIPLLNESRFVNRQNPIIAILDRIVRFPQIFVIVYSYYLLSASKFFLRKSIAVISLLILILFNILSGSKGFILSFVYCYFIYNHFYLERKIKIKVRYLIPILISPIIVISIYNGTSDFMSSLSFLLYRFTANGDGYWQGFAYDVIKYINNTASWYERVFSFVLGPLGLISPNAKIPIGTLILNQINPATVGLLEGANSRIPLFCYVCFGNFVSPIAAFVFGVVAAKITYVHNLSFSSRIVSSIVKGAFYMCGITMITDPTLCLSSFVDLIFGILMLNAFCVFNGLKSPVKLV